MIKIGYKIVIMIIFVLFIYTNVYATNEIPENLIDYIEVSKDNLQSCEVSISIPYSYSNTIPKEPQKPVQTGDDSNIVLYGICAILSTYGMVIVSKKKI